MTLMCLNHPDTPARARTLCPACYHKARRAAIHADRRKQAPGLHPIKPRAGSGIVRIIAKATADVVRQVIAQHPLLDSPPEPDECRIWTGATNEHGSPVMFRWGGAFQVRRMLWAVNGGDPHVEVVKTTCGISRCLNVSHMVGTTFAAERKTGAYPC